MRHATTGVIAWLVSLFIITAAAKADTIYWDGSGSDWDIAASWSTSASAATPDPSSYPVVTDTAIFSSSTAFAAAQTVNLNADQSVQGIQVLVGGGVFTPTSVFNGSGGTHSLTIGTGGITTFGDGVGANNSTNAGSFTLNPNIIVDGNQNWAIGSSFGVLVNGNVTAGSSSSTISLSSYSNGSFATFNGVLADNGANQLGVSITSTASGSGEAGVAMKAANTYTGDTTAIAKNLFSNNPLFVLSGYGASIAFSNLTLKSNAYTQFDSSAGTPVSSVTRAKSLTMAGAPLYIIGDSAGNNTHDVITNAFTVNSGASQVNLNPNGSGKNVYLSAGSLVRNAGGGLLVTGASLGAQAPGSGSNTTNFKFDTSPSAQLVNGILPWAMGTTTLGGTGADWLTYDNTNGFKLYTGYGTSLTSGTGSTVNVKTGSAQNLGSSTVTVNSLIVNVVSTTAVSGSGHVLNIGSGGLATTAGGNATLTGGTIAFGSAEGVITNSNAVGNQLIIADAISGTNGLTKTGPGRTNLTSAANANANLFGTITVNQGTLNTSRDDNFGDASNAIVVNSGAVILMGSNTTTANTRTITLNGYACSLNSNGTWTINAVIGGNGQLFSNSTGPGLILTGTNTYTLGTVIAKQSLSISNDVNLGAVPTSPQADNVSFSGSSGFNQALKTTGTTTLNANRGITLTSAYSAVFDVAPSTTLTIAGSLSNGGGTSGFTKNNTGTLLLSGTSSYDGTTTVNNGGFGVKAGAVLGNTTINYTASNLSFVANPTAPTGAGSVTVGNNLTAAKGGSLSLTSGSSFSMGGDAAAGTVNFVQGGSFAGASIAFAGTSGSANNLTMDVTGTVGVSDKITTTGSVTTAGTGGVVITLSSVNGTMGLGQYVLIDAPGGGLGTNAFVIGNPGSVFVDTYGFTLGLSLSDSTSTQEILTVTPEPASLALIGLAGVALLGRKGRKPCRATGICLANRQS